MLFCVPLSDVEASCRGFLSQFIIIHTMNAWLRTWLHLCLMIIFLFTIMNCRSVYSTLTLIVNLHCHYTCRAHHQFRLKMHEIRFYFLYSRGLYLKFDSQCLSDWTKCECAVRMLCPKFQHVYTHHCLAWSWSSVLSVHSFPFPCIRCGSFYAWEINLDHGSSYDPCFL